MNSYKPVIGKNFLVLFKAVLGYNYFTSNMNLDVILQSLTKENFIQVNPNCIVAGFDQNEIKICIFIMTGRLITGKLSKPMNLIRFIDSF